MASPASRLRRFQATQSPENLLILGFGVLIVLGAGLLLLPWAHRGELDLLEALFTATSAVCVTGLAVVDTGAKFTPLGQAFLLLMIQTGGIGVMTAAGIAFALMGRRLNLNAQAALSSSMLQREAAGEFRSMFWRILGFVLAVELVGAVLLYIDLRTEVTAAAWSAVFHSVSAFCNAGFSLYSDSLTGLRARPLAMIVIMALIILGGIGHPVAVDLWRRYDPRSKSRGPLRRLSLGSKVALGASALLIVAGFGLLLIAGGTPDQTTASERVWGALFQSVTTRTAGFNTIEIGAMNHAALFLMVMLMFIGGSPGSCAGGVKTTTFAMWAARLWSRLRGHGETQMFGRHIPEEIAQRVSTLMGLAVVWNVTGVFVLLVTEGDGAHMSDIVFEQVSAFATVGLTTGTTPELSTFGRLWIIASMFIGRLGPLTLALSLLTRKRAAVRYPEGRIMIG